MPQQYGNSNMYSSSGNVRIRKPHPHDVLSGRGGGINSHPGNKTFRSWVQERKEAYNLAITKAEKAEVAHEVMNLVRSQSPPGRFLQRDPRSPVGFSWWAEVDSNRALAKTSQALREGAPQIRAAHKEELGEKMERARKSRRRSRTATASQNQPPPQQKSPVVDEALRALQKNVELARTQAEQQRTATPSNIVPPLVSNSQFEASYMRPTKRTKFERILPQIGHSSETPPLTSAATSVFQEPTPALIMPVEVPRAMSRDSAKALMRTNSLALSDFSQGDMKDEDLTGDFVDPFADESDLLIDTTLQQKAPRLLRNISSGDRPTSIRRNSSLSSRSITNLPDFSDDPALLDLDFDDIQTALDAKQPDVISEDEDWKTPVLMPWRGIEPFQMRRRNSSKSSMSSNKWISGRQ